MQWTWPAVVNYYEAKAYCEWLNEQNPGQTFRLPNEAEYLNIRDIDIPDQQQWQASAEKSTAADAVMHVATAKIYNLNLRFGSESPGRCQRAQFGRVSRRHGQCLAMVRRRISPLKRI
jgi:hypothetical protein